MERMERESAALLALLRQRPRGRTWGSIATEVSLEGSAFALLAERDEDALFSVSAPEDELSESLAILQEWRSKGYEWVTVLDDDYPARLRDIREMPPFLFYQGELCAADDGMSVVGSREASEWGLRFAADTARLLVSEGLTVIGGLAAGIDAEAHRTALDTGGRTVAFLGTGIAISYPPKNADLQAEIGGSGLVLSQFYPDAPPTKKTFPQRNASMSGYGLATIVVDAGEYSGTRVQARLAGEHGRPVILTSRVTATTTWGAELASRPNVYVVRDLDELQFAIDEVRQVRVRLQSALDALSAS